MSSFAAPDIETVDPAEVERFTRIAQDWWDPDGPFAPLHRFNPVRVAYLLDRVANHFERSATAPKPLAGLHLLDIGCGGGLMAEPMARLGAQVTAIDASDRTVAIAKRHADQMGLAIDYRCSSAEALLAEEQRFDIVLSLEVLEHVTDCAGFLAQATALMRPYGLLVTGTLNRTVKALALAVIGAEYLLRWLPRGTHDWRKFIRPCEQAAYLRACGALAVDLTGVSYHPFTGQWRLSRDVDVNYLMSAVRLGL